MSIGKKILELRKTKNMSQEDLAEKINVTRQTISKWELDETSPDLKQAKELSKVFNTSLDDLADNDVKNIIVEKVSNTEKLAGIVIKILKAIGIFFGIFILGMIVLFCLLVFVRKEPENDKIFKETTLKCNFNEVNYEITINTDKYYNCDNCTKEMNTYLKDITDWANFEHSVENIKTYFDENGGHCK